MNAALLNRFADIAYARAGIRLRDGKEALVSARVGKRMRALELERIEDYLAILEGPEADQEIVYFLDAISTNFTSFLREPDHFVRFAELVQTKLEAGQRRLRFWCAASSTGEEPYTIAMTAAEVIGERDVDWRILATDISTRVLSVAEAGVYDDPVLEPVPRAQRERWFTKMAAGGPRGPRWAVAPALKQHVTFKRLNLATPPFPMKGPLDAVFCRNVMIYFDQPVRQQLIAGIERLLAPDAILFIGHSETLSGLDTQLRALKPSVYAPRSDSTRTPGRGQTS
jgi:chemotaxis protein methyltransferase CheR